MRVSNIRPESAEDIENLVKIGLDQVQLSIDGVDSHTNDFLKGKGSFKRLIKTANHFKKIKDKFQTKKPIITLNSTLNSKNYDRLIDFVHLADDLGCNEIILHPLLIFAYFLVATRK